MTDAPDMWKGRHDVHTIIFNLAEQRHPHGAGGVAVAVNVRASVARAPDATATPSTSR